MINCKLFITIDHSEFFIQKLVTYYLGLNCKIIDAVWTNPIFFSNFICKKSTTFLIQCLKIVFVVANVYLYQGVFLLPHNVYLKMRRVHRDELSQMLSIIHMSIVKRQHILFKGRSPYFRFVTNFFNIVKFFLFLFQLLMQCRRLKLVIKDLQKIYVLWV